ncbi:MAG: ZIP family metal transporter [bacterium]
MSLNWVYTLISVFIVSILSFVGVVFIAFRKNTLNKLLLFLVSFSAGSLFGGAFIHLLPEAIEEYGLNLNLSLNLLSGILVFFILEKIICWRHCHIPTSDKHPHPLVFMNLIGDGLHNFIDGMVIAGSFLVDPFLGFTTTLAVILHEIPQEIGDFGVLIYGGFKRRTAFLLNFASALTAVLGAVAVLILSLKIKALTAFLLPFTAGGFIYIAGSDLIPELKKETGIQNSLFQLFAIILGIGVMTLVLFIHR